MNDPQVEYLQKHLEYALKVLEQFARQKDFQVGRVKELSEKLDYIKSERDYYKAKFEQVELKLFLSNFTKEEQYEILNSIGE